MAESWCKVTDTDSPPVSLKSSFTLLYSFNFHNQIHYHPHRAMSHLHLPPSIYSAVTLVLHVQFVQLRKVLLRPKHLVEFQKYTMCFIRSRIRPPNHPPPFLFYIHSSAYPGTVHRSKRFPSHTIVYTVGNSFCVQYN